MKYFTRSFVHGLWSEARRREAYEAYVRRLSELCLSPAMQLLGEMNFHDARVLKMNYQEPSKLLDVRLRRGHLQRGYFDANLGFSGVRIGDKSLQLLRGAVRPSKAEVLATELDASRGRFHFRSLLWPEGEIAFSFEHVTIKTKAVSGRKSR